jgi:hypothetical protein
MSFLLNTINGSIQNELSRFFQVLDDSPISLVKVSTAAFCKARKKLSYLAFKELNKLLVDSFYQTYAIKRWNGFRLLAIDGSVTQLPQSKILQEYYGKARKASNRPAIRVSFPHVNGQF